MHGFEIAESILTVSEEVFVVEEGSLYPALQRLLAQDGLLGAGWAPEFGGSGVDPGFAHAVFDELRSGGLMWDGWSTTVMVINTIAHVGSDEQKRTIISAALRGEILIALGYSEPDSGSDVAAASTRAVTKAQRVGFMPATLPSGGGSMERDSRCADRDRRFLGTSLTSWKRSRIAIRRDGAPITLSIMIAFVLSFRYG